MKSDTVPSDPPASDAARPPEALTVARARGLIAAIIEAMPDGGEPVLFVCDAWGELDEPGVLPELISHRPVHGQTPVLMLVEARRLLTEAILLTGSVSRMIAYTSAARNLDAALTFLRAPVPTGESRV